MEQTAVEWLVNKLPQRMLNYLKEEIEQAKEMEKQQIIEAYDAGLFDGSMDDVNDRIYKQYYNEEYNK